MKTVQLVIFGIALLPIILAKPQQGGSGHPSASRQENVEKCKNDDKAKSSPSCFSACMKKNDQILVDNKINWDMVDKAAEKLANNPPPNPSFVGPKAELLAKLRASIEACKTQVPPQADECATAQKLDDCFSTQMNPQ